MPAPVASSSVTDPSASAPADGAREGKPPRSAFRRRRGRDGGRRAKGPGGQGPAAPGAEANGSLSGVDSAGQSASTGEGADLPVYSSSGLIGLDAGDPARRALKVVVDDDQPKLHKVLADSGLGSRRDMEDLIVAGRVSVNGQPAHVGQRIGPTDQVRVNGRPIRRPPAALPPRVLLYHKNSGEICTRDDPSRRSTVFERLPRIKGARWVAVGRLDFNTEGLLIFTTSGDIANRLMHPRYGWEREYAVRILGRIDDAARETLLNGVQLDDGPAQFSTVEELGGDGANAWYRVVIAEGRNREVRRMFEAVNLTVSRLVRLRFGPVALPRGLARARWIELAAADVVALQRLLKGDEAGRDESREAAGHDDESGWDDEDRFDGEEDPADAIGNYALPEPDETELPPELTDDEWQPSSRDAHLEGITRVVRKGEGPPRAPGQGRRGRGGPRGAAQAFVGPMDHGATPAGDAQPGAGRRSGRGGRGGPAGGGQGPFGPRAGARGASQPGQRSKPQGQRGSGGQGGQGGQGARGATQAGAGPRGQGGRSAGQGGSVGGQPGGGGRSRRGRRGGGGGSGGAGGGPGPQGQA